MELCFPPDPAANCDTALAAARPERTDGLALAFDDASLKARGDGVVNGEAALAALVTKADGEATLVALADAPAHAVVVVAVVVLFSPPPGEKGSKFASADYGSGSTNVNTTHTHTPNV